MKVYCNNCSIHFKHEFETTMKPPCNYWGEMGMSTLQPELKKKLWDWLFEMPADEIGIAAKLGISFSINSAPITEDSKFENIIPGYDKMNEKQRQEAQRTYFKMKKSSPTEQIVIKKDITVKDPERKVN